FIRQQPDLVYLSNGWQQLTARQVAGNTYYYQYGWAYGFHLLRLWPPNLLRIAERSLVAKLVWPFCESNRTSNAAWMAGKGMPACLAVSRVQRASPLSAT